VSEFLRYCDDDQLHFGIVQVHIPSTVLMDNIAQMGRVRKGLAEQVRKRSADRHGRRILESSQVCQSEWNEWETR
jgi:hypothetical protein